MSFGGSSSQTYSPYAPLLAQMAAHINQEVDPVRKMFFQQLQQILSGNLFTNSTLPMVAQGVAAQRQAGAESMAGAEAAGARSGVDRSPFMAAIKSLMGQGTNAAIGAVPGQVAGEYLGLVPGAVQGVGGQALSGLASAMQGNIGTSTSKYNVDIGQQLSSLQQGAGSMIGGMAAGGMLA